MSAAPRPPGLRPGGAAGIDRTGLEHPVNTISAGQSQPIPLDLGEIRFQREVKRLHDVGPRALYQVLDELGARFLRRTEIETVVRKYAALDPVAAEAVGARGFAPMPLHVVEGQP
jgi:hypothetical protein